MISVTGICAFTSTGRKKSKPCFLEDPDGSVCCLTITSTFSGRISAGAAPLPGNTWSGNSAMRVNSPASRVSCRSAPPGPRLPVTSATEIGFSGDCSGI
ncbi:hypothetical protein D3C87_1481530 [compost metagenome]